MKKKLIHFILAFAVAALTLYLAWVILVHPCNIYTPIYNDEKRCLCLGKTIDFNKWLGKFEPDRVVHYESCVGFVRKVIK